MSPIALKDWVIALRCWPRSYLPNMSSVLRNGLKPFERVFFSWSNSLLMALKVSLSLDRSAHAGCFFVVVGVVWFWVAVFWPG